MMLPRQISENSGCPIRVRLTGPPVRQDDGDGLGFAGEESNEVDLEVSVEVIDLGGIVGERVQLFFGLSPRRQLKMKGTKMSERYTHQSKAFHASVALFNHFRVIPRCSSVWLFSNVVREVGASSSLRLRSSTLAWGMLMR